MDIKLAHGITIVSMFVTCFVACLLPSIFHVHTEPNSRKRRILSALTSYCNCLSGGVFAGAFFTQFYPHVVKEFSLLFVDEHSIWNHPIQLGPTIVFLGFLMTALLERLVSVVLARLRRRQLATNDRHPTNAQELNRVVDGGQLILDTDDDENSVDTDPLSPPMDPRLPGQKKHSHHHHDHSHGSSSHSHRGHHHHHHDVSLDEYQGMTRFVVLVASLGTHSIFEGVALGLLKNVGLLFNMFFSIVVHELLMALALGISLSRQKMKLQSRLAFCLVFSVIIPVGQVIGLLIQQAPANTAATASITVLHAIAAGTFLHVMFMEILPQEMEKHFGIIEALWVLMGYFLIPLTTLVVGAEHG